MGQDRDFNIPGFLIAHCIQASIHKVREEEPIKVRNCKQPIRK